jgi:glycosyltransferase involved in cell wall biosynthesis
VTSGAGGLREVGGDAAVIVDGRDPAAYVQVLVDLSEDQDRREALIALGMHRAEGFTWRRAADQTADVYRTFL